MNQGPKWVRLIEKSRGQKSRATVPLRIQPHMVSFRLRTSHLLCTYCILKTSVHILHNVQPVVYVSYFLISSWYILHSL
jgi:hypothetical protein